MLVKSMQADELAELRGTACLDKMEGAVQHPADAPTRVRRQGVLDLPGLNCGPGASAARLGAGPGRAGTRGLTHIVARCRHLSRYPRPLAPAWHARPPLGMRTSACSQEDEVWNVFLCLP